MGSDDGVGPRAGPLPQRGMKAGPSTEASSIATSSQLLYLGRTTQNPDAQPVKAQIQGGQNGGAYEEGFEGGSNASFATDNAFARAALKQNPMRYDPRYDLRGQNKHGNRRRRGGSSSGGASPGACGLNAAFFHPNPSQNPHQHVYQNTAFDFGQGASRGPLPGSNQGFPPHSSGLINGSFEGYGGSYDGNYTGSNHRGGPRGQGGRGGGQRGVAMRGRGDKYNGRSRSQFDPHAQEFRIGAPAGTPDDIDGQVASGNGFGTGTESRGGRREGGKGVYGFGTISASPTVDGDGSGSSSSEVDLMRKLVEVLKSSVPCDREIHGRALQRILASLSLGDGGADPLPTAQGLGLPGNPNTNLVHPEEFRNPSSFLKVYGDPLCFNSQVPLPRKGRNGNWSCGNCRNVNFPRRVKCNVCGALRDARGDWLVSDYVQQVYDRYLALSSMNAHTHANPRAARASQPHTHTNTHTHTDAQNHSQNQSDPQMLPPTTASTAAAIAAARNSTQWAQNQDAFIGPGAASGYAWDSKQEIQLAAEDRAENRKGRRRRSQHRGGDGSNDSEQSDNSASQTACSSNESSQNHSKPPFQHRRKQAGSGLKLTDAADGVTGLCLGAEAEADGQSNRQYCQRREGLHSELRLEVGGRAYDADYDFRRSDDGGYADARLGAKGWIPTSDIGPRTGLIGSNFSLSRDYTSDAQNDNHMENHLENHLEDHTDLEDFQPFALVHDHDINDLRDGPDGREARAAREVREHFWSYSRGDLAATDRQLALSELLEDGGGASPHFFKNHSLSRHIRPLPTSSLAEENFLLPIRAAASSHTRAATPSLAHAHTDSHTLTDTHTDTHTQREARNSFCASASRASLARHLSLSLQGTLGPDPLGPGTPSPTGLRM